MEYKEIGRYGMLRHHYLEEHQPALFWQLLLEGTLESHLVQVDAFLCLFCTKVRCVSLCVVL